MSRLREMNLMSEADFGDANYLLEVLKATHGGRSAKKSHGERGYLGCNAKLAAAATAAS